MPTVAALCRRLGPDLQPLPGVGELSREISAVHISELPDPTGYLSGGELLLSTGLALPADPQDCAEYAERLAAAGVSALALGLGPVHNVVPPALTTACADRGVPLLVVPEPTPFLRITAAFWSMVSGSTERQLRDVLTAQQALVAAGSSRSPEPSLLRAVCRSVGGWAATFDPEGELREVAPRHSAKEAALVQGELGRLRGAGIHSAASMSMGATTVIIYPLAAADRIVGFLAVGTPEPLDAPRRRLVLTAVTLLSLEAVRLSRADAAMNEAERCVGLLVERGLVDAACYLASAVDVTPPPPWVRVLAVDGDDCDAALETVRRWCPEVIAVLAGPALGWALVPVIHPPLAALDRALSQWAPAAGAFLSESVPVTAVTAARTRLIAALCELPPGTRRLQPDDPGGYNLAGCEALEQGLAHLDTSLIQSLAGYLRHRGQWETTARDLGIHRNTLRYRIDRCARLLAVDLTDPDVAAQLWLLLRRRALG